MRHDNPDLQGTFQSEDAKPETLLQTENVTATVGSVLFDLPSTPWTRFVVKIENWRSVSDNVNGYIRCGILGTIRSGASDYDWGLHAISAASGESNNYDQSDSEIHITRDAANWRFGNAIDESWSFDIDIDPGNGSNPLVAPFSYPKCWWQGSGYSDGDTMVTVYGGALYKGVTSAQWGRMDQIQFENPGSIAWGNFRLYGME